MHAGGGQERTNAKETNDDAVSFVRTDVEKVLEFELLKLKDEQKKNEAVLFETRAQRDLFQSKYLNLSLKVDSLLDDIKRLEPNIFKVDIKIASLCDSTLDSVFDKLKEAFYDKNSKDGFLNSDQENEKQRFRQQIQVLCKEQEDLRNELESSKSHAFGLLQKLSCARSELIASEENHRKRLSSIVTNFDNEKQNIEASLSSLRLERDEATSSLMARTDELSSCQRSMDESLEEISRLKASVKVLQEENKMLSIKSENLESNRAITSTAEDTHKTESESHSRHLERECDRLRKHLVTMEERYTQDALESEAQKEELQKQVEKLRSKLATSLTSVKNVQSDSSKQMEAVVAQLNESNSEKAELRRRLEESEKLVSRYASSIENLHAVLEQYEKNHQLMQLAELEKCRKDLRSESARCARLVQQNDSLEEENSRLKSQLTALKENEDKVRVASTHIGYLQYLVSERDENLKRLADELNKLREDHSAKVDKIIMKNMLMGYLHAPSSKKVEAFSVVGKFLDFSKEELASINMSGSWSNYVKQQYSPIDHPSSEHAHPQSFSELFIKFLENESRPSRPIPRLSTETQEGKPLGQHPAYQSSDSTRQQKPMQKFLQSLRQQTGNLSPTADLLNENVPESNFQKYASSADLSAPSDDVPAVDSSEDAHEDPPFDASVLPLAVV